MNAIETEATVAESRPFLRHPMEGRTGYWRSSDLLPNESYFRLRMTRKA